MKAKRDADIESRVMQVRRVAGAIRAIENTKALSLKCAKLLYEGMPAIH